MIKKYKDILFYPVNEDCADLTDPPMPASKYIPDWYKNIPKYTNNDKKFSLKNNIRNQTVKSCLPVLDSFTTGYMFVLNCDIQVNRNSDGSVQINSAFGDRNISSDRTKFGVPAAVLSRKQNSEQKVDESCAWSDIEGYDPLEFNWFPSWNVRTPKGYSAIFCHPINRIDLPFYTLGGIIDTDGWGDAGSHPFLLKKGWEGIIKKGTPIFQVIPFKRDNWQNKVDKTMIKEYNKQISKRDSFLYDYYKKFVWNSKNFK